MKKLCVVVPFFNERENLPLLYERTVKALEGQPEELEFLFVDDGSSDGSAEWVAARAREDARVRLLRLSRNFGHQIAITAGMDKAEGDAVVIIDADLQDPPEVIPELLARWREGCEVVYAVRRRREGEPWLKKFLAAAFYRIFKALAQIEAPLDAGDFRLVDRRVVLAMREVRELHRFMRGLTCWVGYRQGAVTYDRAARHEGETKYPFWKSWKLAMDALTSFSGGLLRWVTAAGMVIALVGFVWLAYTIVRKFMFPDQFVWGWTSLVALILVVSGVQIVCTGLVGQYVSRIFEESKKRPLYFLRD
jgi:polyisoprenyl-phosphate glycosyltransferase